MWSKVGDRVIESSDFIKATEEKIAEVRENLWIAQSRQKSHVDKRRWELKLAPRYIGPYPIIKRIGVVAYKIKLLEHLSDVHNGFHVSQLQKCIRVPEDQVVSNTLDQQDDLRYQEVPIKILDTMTRRTRTRTINLCKVHWSRHSEAEATWEREDVLKEKFPHLFEEHSESRG
jgi:hypothetical protein